MSAKDSPAEGSANTREAVAKDQDEFMSTADNIVKLAFELGRARAMCEFYHERVIELTAQAEAAKARDM